MSQRLGADRYEETKQYGEESFNLAGSEGRGADAELSRGQFSYEYGGSNAPFSNGLFTRAFVDAISGRSPEADADRNGVVTLGEIRDYLESRVPKDAQLYCNGMQNPTFTMMKGASFSDIADYKLFEDMPIFGRHPRDWRRGQTFCREAERLKKMRNTLRRSKELRKPIVSCQTSPRSRILRNESKSMIAARKRKKRMRNRNKLLMRSNFRKR